LSVLSEPAIAEPGRPPELVIPPEIFVLPELVIHKKIVILSEAKDLLFARSS
jgi:hypothetical protein